MASLARRRPQNAAGEIYVDTTCIDCDACRWIAPATFDRAGTMSRVHTQPADPEAARRALMALLACPTGSIGTVGRPDLRSVLDAFPERIAGPVHHCGFHDASSFGAASYLVLREEGNVLVDSPRFAAPLRRRLEELGGVRWMMLTHRDDVAHHDRFARHFGCERILHEADLSDATRDVEHVLTGTDAVELDGVGRIVPVPGHTAGSCCLLHEEFLFSGDHLAWGPAVGHLYAFRSVCWYDWDEQIRSMERLAELPFTWVLPAHGRRARLRDAAHRREQMARCLAWMRERA